MSFKVEPLVLEGRYLRLEPLAQEHANGLFNRGRQEEDWLYLPRPGFVDLADCRHWIDEANATAGQMPFAMVEKKQGRAVGSSRFMAIREPHRGLEIGYTWIGRDWQGTVVNVEAKLLMLQHAIETLGAIRVEFKTDARNERSQRALKGIGAHLEGTFRNHMIAQEGFLRDSVYFSVTPNDWSQVQERLLERLDRQGEEV
jgi:RimJ/RimL family protein N-acetyltransferase